VTDLNLTIVVAAVIERDGRFLVTRRLKNTHLAGLWEFPGGKCELGETHDACLRRELLEELGVASTVGEEIVVSEHAYPDRVVRLHFLRCTLAGPPRALLGQQMRWVTREELGALELPEGDQALVAILVGHSPA
jgi:8-oxo-dGTP diphosphatase